MVAGDGHCRRSLSNRLLLCRNVVKGVCHSRLDKRGTKDTGAGAVSLVAQVAQAVVGVAHSGASVENGVDALVHDPAGMLHEW